MDDTSDNTQWVLLTEKFEVFFVGTYAQFENCYGGGGGNPEGDIIQWARRQNCQVYRRVDTDYIKE